MRVYVSGSMSLKRAANHPSFDAADKYLRRLGHQVWNPAEIDRSSGVDPDGDVVWEDCLRRDLFVIASECEAMAFLPGWEVRIRP